MRAKSLLIKKKTNKKDKPHKSPKCGHVIPDLKAETFQKETEKGVSASANAIMDNLPEFTGVEKVVASCQIQTVQGKEAPNVLPWVHIAISNAKAWLLNIHHGLKDEPT